MAGAGAVGPRRCLWNHFGILRHVELDRVRHAGICRAQWPTLDRDGHRKDRMRGFGHLERDVMRAIWHAPRPVTGREIADGMTTHAGLAYTTVITVIERLREKGYLERRRDGRAYRYHALISEEEHASALMEQVLDDADDRSGALLRFAGRLDPEEAEALRIALQQRR